MKGTLVLIAYLAFTCNGVLGNGLKNFLSTKLKEFPNWIQENKLDPYPLSVGPIHLSTTHTSRRYQVDLTLSNVYVTDIGNPILRMKSYPYLNAYRADCMKRTFEVDLFHSLQWHGDFKMNGTEYRSIQEKKDIKAGGKFSASGNDKNTFLQAILVENFGISDDGQHIDLSKSGSIRFFNSNGIGQNLWPGINDYERNPSLVGSLAVNAVGRLMKEYMEQLEATDSHPANVLLRRFLDEKFQETTIDQIESWTD